MNCPKCHKPMKRGAVIDVRWKEGYVYRRRECGYCGHRVTTEERIAKGKDDGTRGNRHGGRAWPIEIEE